jgi:hypothetical protein
MPNDLRPDVLTRRDCFAATARGLWAFAAGGALAPLLALQTGSTSIAGIITDSSGAVVAQTTITLTNQETGVSRSTVSGGDGSYRFGELPPGTYDLAVSCAGFATYRLTGIVPGTGEMRHYNIQLSVGSVSEPVSVEAGPPRITTRDLLLDESREEDGYGLYSYVLFGRPATDSTRERYIAVLREYLALPEAARFKKNKVPLSQLNVTYLPATGRPQDETPEKALDVYDYARAQELLAMIPGGPRIDGPYIVSSQVRLSELSGTLTGNYLYQDMSSVPPSIIVLWVREFMMQAGKKDYWRRRDGPHAALQLRTAIARLATGIDPTRKALKDWQGILASLVFWKPATAGSGG